MSHTPWHTALAELCFAFCLVVLIYTLYLHLTRKRGASRRGLPKPSEKCKRSGTESVP